MAFPNVLEGFAARKVPGCVLECGEGEKVFILQNKKNPSLLRFYYQKTPFSP
jgi:hypothetical protein